MQRFSLTMIGGMFLFLFTSNSFAELKWIPDTQRSKADLAGNFKTPDGTNISLRDLKDKVVFLNFWATWCEPCKEEMPAMAKLKAELRDPRFEMIAVTTSSRRDVQKFLATQAFDFTILLDPQDSIGTRFKTELVPTTIIVDASGRVAFRRGGAFAWDSQEAVDGLRSLLAEKPGTAPVAAVASAPAAREAADRLTGTWTGDWGPTAADRNVISVDLKLDGTAVTGIVHSIKPERPDIPIRKGTFNPATRRVHLEADVPNPRGGNWRPLHYVITGVIAEDSLLGSWNHAEKKGDFTLSKK